jgi:hypothetical protein
MNQRRVLLTCTVAEFYKEARSADTAAIDILSMLLWQ